MRWLGQQERLHLLRQHQGHRRSAELQSQTALKQINHSSVMQLLHPFGFTYYHWFSGFDLTELIPTVFYFDKCFVYLRFCHFYVRAVRLFYIQNQILKYFEIPNFCFLILLSDHTSYLILDRLLYSYIVYITLHWR